MKTNISNLIKYSCGVLVIISLYLLFGTGNVTVHAANNTYSLESGRVRRRFDVAINSSGNPVVAYIDSSLTSPVLKLLVCADSSCSTVDSVNEIQGTGDPVVTQKIDLALLSDDSPVISYVYDDFTDIFRLIKCGNATCTSGNTITDFPDDTTGGSSTKILIAANGDPIVIRMAQGMYGPELKITKCGNSACTSGNQTSTLINGLDGDFDAVLGNDNNPIIAVPDSSGSLYVLDCDDEFCSTYNQSTLENYTLGFLDFDTSMDLDNDGIPIIAVNSGWYGERDLLVYKCSDVSCTTFSKNSVAGFGSNSPSVGWRPDIYWNSSGFPLIAYRDNTNTEVILTQCGDIECSTNNTTVMTTSSECNSASLPEIVFNSNGIPLLFYVNHDWTVDGGLLVSEIAPQITGITGNLDVRDADTRQSVLTYSVYAYQRLLQITDSGIPVSEITVDLISDLDWSSVTADTDTVTGKSVINGITAAPGTASTHALYIPIPEGVSADCAYICPDATTLGDVGLSCTNGETVCNGETVTIGTDDVTLSKETIEGNSFLIADGVSGTGGMSLFSSFALKDTLTRLEVSQASDHTIEFGSVNGLTNSGDTIEIQFDPAGQNWDLSSIGIADIDLEDDGVDKTLAAAPGADTWGVSIDTGTDTITFTAPTSGTDYISASSILVVKVGTNADGGSNQITNPSSVGEYEVSMKNTYSAGSGGTETGEVSVPIVDDDTVNITGYIDTVMSFDIDTAVSDVQCDAAGGASACNSHGGASDGAGYVVDVGELTLSTVNKSGDSVAHADGLTGNINYIWFDLETNASSGAVVTVVSQYESLYKDSTNEIPSVATGSEQQILAASGLYGLNHRSGFTNSTAIGSMLVDVDCDASAGDDYYCDVADGGTPISIFDSNSLPIDDGRMQFSVGASPDSADGTGTYTDQLTFVASATF